MSKRYAIVSVGTNSTRMLLADVEPERPRVEFARSIGTRVGEGLTEGGRLGEEPMQRTLDAIEQLLRAVRGHYVRLFAVATSALRRAENGAEFAQKIGDLLGIAPRVLTGEEEAQASYRGALTAFDDLRGERAGVIDVGGGSTEYAVGTTDVPEKLVSCEIGAVRLTEAVPLLAGNDGPVDADTVARARGIASAALEPVTQCAPVERVALVGGSATTTAAIIRERPAATTAVALTRADLQRTLERLLKLGLDERKNIVGMRRQRADILPAGILILDVALELLGQDRAIATTADLLLGILLQERDSAGQPSRARAGSQSRKGFRP